MVCTACSNSTNSSAKFCSSCGNPFAYEPFSAPQGRLVRPREGRMIAGVCAGFAQHYGWDVTLVRIVLCLVVLCGAGSPILGYFIAWILMPNLQYVQPSQATGATAS
ncbi:PspC domain-containing protein [Granulicella mallensis]|jgi:phage shock protein C|uniref:Phage shock protein C, PspC n=2 Tax=Granulicella mallensis TaxID=940614 RepID=G8NT59_GRAMM|nr:PspC domain-containing protein [Granulicella mallensis]AEU37489.1 phage shock protein C, PspC [Granulicella mallensis MP5ACTX8]MBB5066113.1 phage shock protein C [Granulicella mallensis]